MEIAKVKYLKWKNEMEKKKTLGYCLTIPEYYEKIKISVFVVLGVSGSRRFFFFFSVPLVVDPLNIDGGAAFISSRPFFLFFFFVVKLTKTCFFSRSDGRCWCTETPWRGRRLRPGQRVQLPWPSWPSERPIKRPRPSPGPKRTALSAMTTSSTLSSEGDHMHTYSCILYGWSSTSILRI